MFVKMQRIRSTSSSQSYNRMRLLASSHALVHTKRRRRGQGLTCSKLLLKLGNGNRLCTCGPAAAGFGKQ